MSILNVNQIQPVGGGSTITVSANDVNFSGNISIGSSFVGTATTASLATSAQGLTGTPDITVGNIQSGVVTATTFIGDGSGLTGVTASGSGINIKNNGSTVGVAATVDFGTNLNISPAAAGIVTVTVGDTDFAIADKIVHTGDTDTAIRFPGADQVSIETGGTQRLLIGSDGKLVHSTSAAETVDFGTSNSSGSYHKYDLGSSGATVGYIGAGSQIVSGSNVADFGIRSQANLVFSSGGDVEKLRITSSGNIGIGTNNPSRKLHINAGVTDTAMLIESTDGDVQINFKDGDSTNGVSIGCDNEDFYVRSGLTTQRLRITSGGHVNIGGEYSQTDSKVTIVDVSRPIAEATLNLQSSTTSGAADTGPVLRFYGHSGSEGRYHASIKGAKESGNVGSTAAYLAFNTRPSGGGAMAERLRITSSGVIQCGSSSVLKAEINNAVSGHQFISQCSDNNNGFEVYQQHGSNTTRNTFAVYANTGSSSSKDLQFAVRGDGCVTKPKSPAFSANLSSGNLNAATHDNVIIFNNEHFDRANNYNPSNGRFTASVAGTYYFGVQIYAGFGSGAVRVLHAKFQKNGGTIATADMFGGTSDAGGTSFHPTGCGHILTELAVNDYITFHSGSFAGTGSGHRTIYAANGTRFFGYLVG